MDERISSGVQSQNDEESPEPAENNNSNIAAVVNMGKDPGEPQEKNGESKSEQSKPQEENYSENTDTANLEGFMDASELKNRVTNSEVNDDQGEELDEIPLESRPLQPRARWSGLETAGMQNAKCSLLLEETAQFEARLKVLPPQHFFVPEDALDYGSQQTGQFVQFDGATILQLEPVCYQGTTAFTTMPETITIGGKCVFTAANYRYFELVMRNPQQSLGRNLRPNSEFEWPDVRALLMCPFCGATAPVPQMGSLRPSLEYWLVFYPLVQITQQLVNTEGDKRIALGTRMICRLACIECLENVVSDMSVATTNSLDNITTESVMDVLNNMGSASLFLNKASDPQQGKSSKEPKSDAWTVNGMWETSGAWEALNEDYRKVLGLAITQGDNSGQEMQEQQDKKVDHQDANASDGDANGSGGEHQPYTKAQQSRFSAWVESHPDQKPSLHDQVSFAQHLYDEAMGSEPNPQSSEQIILDLQEMPIKGSGSLVTWKGVRVGWFLDVFCQSPYIQLLRSAGCQLWFVRKVCMIEMIRRATAGAANSTTRSTFLAGTFVDFIPDIVEAWGLQDFSRDASDPGPIVSDKPTHFISYTGEYVLEYFCGVLSQLDPEAYIWLDILCVDQFAWTGRGRSEEMKQFREYLMSDLKFLIGKIQQWDNVMSTLAQIWVLWEIFHTVEMKAELVVLLPKHEVQNFLFDCGEMPSSQELKIHTVLQSIDANTARAQDDLDRRYIFGEMEKRGLSDVNAVVVKRMRKWLIDMGQAHLDYLRENEDGASANFLTNMAFLYRDQGLSLKAEPLFREAYESRIEQLGPNHPDTIVSKDDLEKIGEYVKWAT